MHNSESQKPGMESKNVSNARSSFSVCKIRSNIRVSIFDDGSIVSKQFPRLPPFSLQDSFAVTPAKIPIVGRGSGV